MRPNDHKIETVYISDSALKDFSKVVLERAGVPRRNALTVADSLVAASLRGVDSHGVELLLGYVQQLHNGCINVSTSGKVISAVGGTMIYDGCHGLGQVVALACCDHASRLAKLHGISMVVARNSHHYGAGAYWSQTMATKGSIGIAMSTAGPGVAPWQGKTPCIGTNPISIALPGNAGKRWLLDMATTTVAKGKLATSRNQGATTIPEAWGFVDSNGDLTTDSEAALTGWSLPLGGYKGTGLAMMVELLCSGLSGGPMGKEAPSHRDGKVPLRVSHTFIAIDASLFLTFETLDERTDNLVRMMKSSKLRKGFDEVIVAGEPESRAEKIRRKKGIPITKKLLLRLFQLGAELNVDFPLP